MSKKIGFIILLFFTYILIVYLGLMGGEVSGPPSGLSPWEGILLSSVFPISMRNYIVWIFYGGFVVEFIWFTVLFFRAKKIFKRDLDAKGRLGNFLIFFVLIALPPIFIQNYELEMFDFSDTKKCDSFLVNKVIGYHHDSCVMGYVDMTVRDRYSSGTNSERKRSDNNLYEKNRSYESFARNLIRECDLIQEEEVKRECSMIILSPLMNDRYRELLRGIIGIDDHVADEADREKNMIISDNILSDGNKGFELFKAICLQDKERGQNFVNCMRSVVLAHMDIDTARNYSYCSEVSIPDDSAYKLDASIFGDGSTGPESIWKRNCENDIRVSIEEMKNGTINNGNIYMDIPESKFHVIGYTYYNGEQIFDK